MGSQVQPGTSHGNVVVDQILTRADDTVRVYEVWMGDFIYHIYFWRDGETWVSCRKDALAIRTPEAEIWLGEHLPDLLMESLL